MVVSIRYLLFQVFSFLCSLLFYLKIGCSVFFPDPLLFHYHFHHKSDLSVSPSFFISVLQYLLYSLETNPPPPHPLSGWLFFSWAAAEWRGDHKKFLLSRTMTTATDLRWMKLLPASGQCGYCFMNTNEEQDQDEVEEKDQASFEDERWKTIPRGKNPNLIIYPPSFLNRNSSSTK